MNLDRILLDVETQQDLFEPGYMAQDPRPVISQIYRLFDWARENEIPVLSTVLRVRRLDHSPLARKPHCIEGTAGEQKLPGTIFPRRINLGLRNSTDLPGNIFEQYQQVIIEKRDTDIFKHARAERLLTELGHATFVICGAGVAHSIVQAAVGLRTRGFGVVLAQDAVLELNDPLEKMAHLRMEAKGVIYAATAEIVQPRKPARRVPFRTEVRVGRQAG